MRQLRLVLVALLLATTGLYAQEGFYYQAVIKNTDGSPLKESEIRIRIRIIEGETTLQFEEEKTITTSREGFVSFIIGESKPDEFATINWQGELYLQDEVDTGEGYGAPTKMPLLKTPRSYISDRAIRGPQARVAFGTHSELARLERLERGGVVAKVFDPDAIKVMPPHVDGQILGPVIGVALIHDAAVCFDLGHHVGARAGRRFKPGFVQPRPGFLEPVFRPHRHAAHLIDQRPARDSIRKGELDRVIVQRLGAQDTHLDRLCIGRQPLFQQQVVRENDVMRGHFNLYLNLFNEEFSLYIIFTNYTFWLC